MDENHYNSINDLTSSMIRKNNREYDFGDFSDSKFQENLENIIQINESHEYIPKKDLSNLDSYSKKEDFDSIEHLLKTSYQKRNKILEESLINPLSLNLNQAIILLKSYDESRDLLKDDENNSINETYINEIERILEGIHSPDRSPLREKKDQQILLIENNSFNEQNTKNFKEKKIFIDKENHKINLKTKEEEFRSTKSKNCKIF